MLLVVLRSGCLMHKKRVQVEAWPSGLMIMCRVHGCGVFQCFAVFKVIREMSHHPKCLNDSMRCVHGHKCQLEVLIGCVQGQPQW